MTAIINGIYHAVTNPIESASNVISWLTTSKADVAARKQIELQKCSAIDRAASLNSTYETCAILSGILGSIAIIIGACTVAGFAITPIGWGIIAAAALFAVTSLIVLAYRHNTLAQAGLKTDSLELFGQGLGVGLISGFWSVILVGLIAAIFSGNGGGDFFLNSGGGGSCSCGVDGEATSRRNLRRLNNF